MRALESKREDRRLDSTRLDLTVSLAFSPHGIFRRGFDVIDEPSDESSRRPRYVRRNFSLDAPVIAPGRPYRKIQTVPYFDSSRLREEIRSLQINGLRRRDGWQLRLRKCAASTHRNACTCRRGSPCSLKHARAKAFRRLRKEEAKCGGRDRSADRPRRGREKEESSATLTTICAMRPN